MKDDTKETSTREKLTEFFKSIGLVLGIILLTFVLIFSIVGIIVLFVERTRQFNKDIYGKEKKKKGKKNVKRKV